MDKLACHLRDKMNMEKKRPNHHLGSQGHGVALGKGGACVEELLNKGRLAHLVMVARIQITNNTIKAGGSPAICKMSKWIGWMDGWIVGYPLDCYDY